MISTNTKWYKNTINENNINEISDVLDSIKNQDLHINNDIKNKIHYKLNDRNVESVVNTLNSSFKKTKRKISNLYDNIHENNHNIILLQFSNIDKQKSHSYNDTLKLNQFKKTKTSKIFSQQLPVTRLIETLNHKSLQDLIITLLETHPILNETIKNFKLEVHLDSSMKLVQEKYNNIAKNLPYKCEIQSDYSYLRVKPYLNDFLNCVFDFVLHFLTSNESDILKKFFFLNFVTYLIHDLPDFTNSEFKYIKQNTYDQLSNIWLTLLNQINLSTNETQKKKNDFSSQYFYSNNKSYHSSINPSNQINAKNLSLFKLIKNLNLEEKLTDHNNFSNGKFKYSLNLVKLVLDKFKVFENLSGSISCSIDSTFINNNSNSLDLITVDDKNV